MLEISRGGQKLREVTMSDDRWLTVEEVADDLRVHIDTVRGWLRRGELTGTKISRRAGWRIRASEVEAFMQDRAKKAAA